MTPAVPPRLPRTPPPIPPRVPPVIGRLRSDNARPAGLVFRTVEPLPRLDVSLLAELPSLTLQTRYLVDGFLSGRHRSPHKGSSVEFAEYRDYQFGDDLRRVDWRLYGRTDRLHVKQYEEEAQLRVFLVLDASASMDFKSRPQLMSKLVCARIALASIATLAQRQGDAFGLGVMGHELVDFLRARSSVSHWQSFVGRLEAVQPQRETALARTLEALAEIIPPRSLVVVASDFYEELAALQPALRRLRYDDHDLIGLQVLDPLELDFDTDAAGTFVDAEDGTRLKIDAAAARCGYLERFHRFCHELEEVFHEAGGDFAQLRTDQPPVEAMTHYLVRREERVR